MRDKARSDGFATKRIAIRSIEGLMDLALISDNSQELSFHRGCLFVVFFSPVTTVKSVSAELVVEGVDAGCVMTIVVPGPTTVAAWRRNSSGIWMTAMRRSVETVSSRSLETMSQLGTGLPVTGEMESLADGSSMVSTCSVILRLGSSRTNGAWPISMPARKMRTRRSSLVTRIVNGPYGAASGW